jgi:hypothetical protein
MAAGDGKVNRRTKRFSLALAFPLGLPGVADHLWKHPP